MSQIQLHRHVIMNCPELLILKTRIMKTLDFESTVDIFAEFALSNEEMINVRGGDGEPLKTPPPPVKI
jgi:hypothetical protein